MSKVNLYQEIIFANFAPNRSIVDSIGAYGGLITTIFPAKYKQMTPGHQRNERALFWFTVLFSWLFLFTVTVGICYDPAKFFNDLFHAGILIEISFPLVVVFMLYKFAIGQGFLRWMYKNKKQG